MCDLTLMVTQLSAPLVSKRNMSLPPPQLPYDPYQHYVTQCQYGAPLYISRLNNVPPNQSWRLIVLGIIFGIAIIIYFVAFVLFLVRIRRHPLRERFVQIEKKVSHSLVLHFYF